MEVTERVSSLEQRVQIQEDEIQLLKSALADVVRRLNASEEQQALQNRKGPTKALSSCPFQCSNEAVFVADFHPTDTNIIVTCGKSHLYFWTLEGNALIKKQGLFEIPEQFGPVRTVAEGKGDVVLIGTTRNFVLQGTLSGNFTTITQVGIPSACKQVVSVESTRDLEWATFTCTLGFQVFGVWPEGSDGTDLNAICRSGDQKLLATGDDFGKVHLFSYPCSQFRASSHAYGGHSSHVTNVTFLHEDSHLISTGGKDMSIMQWRLL
ncbi:hypothetical protein AB205_0137180 [Aquarana catesbeiana]|uniref:EML-like second beta-propeller domain-containing protein n=1 Tax=Aquarana catesbeiana TaxID=8400 RepID=A0A2G9QH91_AQUCT|nr:hypothetical protein AB205_0137180 [Aquarana catesbeiana]